MRAWRRRIRNALTAASLPLAVAIVVAWVVSVIAFPNVRGAWPGGAGEAEDHVLVCLVDGRVVVFRRVATLVGTSRDMRMTLEAVPVPANPNDWPPPGPRVLVDLGDVRGVTVLDFSVRPPTFAPESYRAMASEREMIANSPWGWLGFDLAGNGAVKPFTISRGGSVSVRERLWAAPLWPLLIAALVPAARLLWQNRRSRRWLRAGRCAACGYDLRATPGQCPECGKPAVAESRAALAAGGSGE